MSYSIQTIMRTSAIIYAEDQGNGGSKSVCRHFVDAAFVARGNTPLKLEQILQTLQDEFQLTYLEKDIEPIISNEKYFTCVAAPVLQNNTYYLPQNRYVNLQNKSGYTVDDAIEEFIGEGDKSIQLEEFRDLLYRFLYNLLNTNISAYQQLLEHGKQIKEDDFSDEKFSDSEKVCINEFLKWDNPEKDKALFKLVNYCIEYATAVNKINPDDVISALRNKCLYLDNALLYRLLGINGDYRKQRAYNLLQRCVESGQKLYVSSVTRKEFFDTIDFHIKQLNQSTPFGKINPDLFRQYSNDSSFYHYYHEWRHNRMTYGFTVFQNYIHAEYDRLLKHFGIQEDFKSPLTEEDDKIIEDYADGIKQLKWVKHHEVHENDAKNLRWLEKNRGDNNHGIRDTKFYFVTTDFRLQSWDLSHSQNQPLTMLPSQWLALLLKFFSRTNNDYKSFVSFLTIPKENVDVQPEDLQEMLAGISEITEDFKMQGDIISSMLETANTNTYQREAAKKFAKEKLEEQFIQKLQQEQENKQNELDTLKSLNAQQLAEQKKMFDDMCASMKEEFVEQEKQDRLNRLIEANKNLHKQLENAKEKKGLIDKCVEQGVMRLKLLGILICVIILVVLVILIYEMGWDKIEKYTYIAGLVIAMFIEIYNWFANKSLSFRRFFDSYKKKKTIHYNNLYNFHKGDIDDLTQAIESNAKQIKSIQQ